MEGPARSGELNEVGPREHQSGVHSFGSVEGVDQKWCLPALSQLGEREYKKIGVHQCFCLQRKCHQIPVPLVAIFMSVSDLLCV